MSEWTREELRAHFDALQSQVLATVSPFGEVEGREDRQARVDACKRDVMLFAETYFPNYVRQAFSDIHRTMVQVCERRNTPQVLAGFRGSGKSTIVDFFVPMHEILYQLCRFYMFGSASTDIATAEYTMPILAHLRTNPRIINDFGETTIIGGEEDFTAGEIRVMAFGRRSSVKGKKAGPWRPDRIRLADVEDRNNIMSPLVARKTVDWIENDVLEAVGHGPDEPWSVVYEFNYFSRKTVGHHLMQRPNWESTTIRALRYEQQGSSSEVSTWPERYPTAMLVKKRREAPHTFEVEWMQNPRDDEAMFRRDWVRYIREQDVPKNLSLYGWCDPSASSRESADFKAYGYIGLDERTQDVYVLRCRVRHETTQQMLDHMFAMHAERPDVRLWGFEGVAFEQYLRELVERENIARGMMLPIMPVLGTYAFAFKKDRIPRLQPMMERGRVHFLEGDSDQETVIQHLLDYPDGRNDDGADWLSGAIELAVMLSRGQSILVDL